MSLFPRFYSFAFSVFLLTGSIHGGATFTLPSSRTTTTTTAFSLISTLPVGQSISMDMLKRIRGGGDTKRAEHPGNAKIEDSERPVSRNLNKLHGMMFSGQLLPSMRKLFAGGSESYARGWQAVKSFHHTGNVAILALFSILTLPFMRLLHHLYYQIASNLGRKESKEFDTSKFSGIGIFVSQAGRIASLVYFVELVATFILNVLAGAPNTVKPQTPASSIPKSLIPLQKFPGLFANCAYGFWFAKHIVRLKSHLLSKFYARLPDPETYDHLLDFLIYIIVSILVLDASQFDLEGLVKSLVAVGGLSSLVVGLALKDPVSQLLQGALMMASNKFRRNEQIRLGDGTQGKVVDIGLLETTIVGGDDIHIHIPHSKMTGQKFSNISRMQKSQTKFQLRFNLHDMYRIDEIAEAIRKELIESCPKLITDGSRPFRVMWTDICEDHIVLTVDTHHNVPPACNAYWKTREQVLLSISNATKKVKARFAMPVQVSASLPKGIE